MSSPFKNDLSLPTKDFKEFASTKEALDYMWVKWGRVRIHKIDLTEELLYQLRDNKGKNKVYKNWLFIADETRAAILETLGLNIKIPTFLEELKEEYISYQQWIQYFEWLEKKTEGFITTYLREGNKAKGEFLEELQAIQGQVQTLLQDDEVKADEYKEIVDIISRIDQKITVALQWETHNYPTIAPDPCTLVDYDGVLQHIKTREDTLEEIEWRYKQAVGWLKANDIDTLHDLCKQIAYGMQHFKPTNYPKLDISQCQKMINTRSALLDTVKRFMAKFANSRLEDLENIKIDMFD